MIDYMRKVEDSLVGWHQTYCKYDDIMRHVAKAITHRGAVDSHLGKECNEIGHMCFQRNAANKQSHTHSYAITLVCGHSRTALETIASRPFDPDHGQSEMQRSETA